MMVLVVSFYLSYLNFMEYKSDFVSIITGLEALMDSCVKLVTASLDKTSPEKTHHPYILF